MYQLQSIEGRQVFVVTYDNGMEYATQNIVGVFHDRESAEKSRTEKLNEAKKQGFRFAVCDIEEFFIQ